MYYNNEIISDFESYLIDNGFKLNYNKTINDILYYYKNDIVVIIERFKNTIIKDMDLNRTYEFDPSTSEILLTDFLKYLQKKVVV